MAPRSRIKMVLVLMESLAGTGHKVVRVRAKAADKVEILHHDPIVDQTVLYKELKKIRTLSSHQGWQGKYSI